jgi:hypothetical protein
MFHLGRLTCMSSLEVALRSSCFRRSLAAAALAGSTGCVHAYDAPNPSEPHASLRIRRVYENARGTYLRETVKLEERVALTVVDPLDSVPGPRVDGMLARLAPAELEVAAETFHRELQTSNEYVTEEIPYRETETYPCGTEAAPGTCSRTVTKHRKETRLRAVPRMVEVRDGACIARQWIAPRANGNYLVEYDYEGNGICQVTCSEEVAGAEPGARETRPCPVPAPADVERAIAAR